MKKNNSAPPIPLEYFQEKLIKIRIRGINDEYTSADVHPDVYKLLEAKVIKSVTNNVELQTFLQSANLTLDKLMYSCITETMLNEAINEL